MQRVIPIISAYIFKYYNNSNTTLNDGEKKHIVVVGGGYAGRAFLKNIDLNKYDVTLVDKNLTIETIFGQQYLKHIPQTSYVNCINNKFNAQYCKISNKIKKIKENILTSDINNNTLISELNTLIKYDYLICADGSKENTYDIVINGGSRCCYLNSIDNIKNLNWLLLSLRSNDPIVVMGGGIAGIEIASELSLKFSNIIIIELADRILPSETEELSNKIKNKLKNINIITNSKINKINRHQIQITSNLEISNLLYSVAIYTCGVQSAGLAKRICGSNIVNDNLCVTKNIYAIGDCNNKLIKSAQHGKQQGKYLAEYFNNNLTSKPFHFNNLGQIIRLNNSVYIKTKYYNGFAPRFISDIVIWLDL